MVTIPASATRRFSAPLRLLRRQAEPPRRVMRRAFWDKDLRRLRQKGEPRGEDTPMSSEMQRVDELLRGVGPGDGDSVSVPQPLLGPPWQGC